MKIFKHLIIVALTVVFFEGCQKEVNFGDGESSRSTLKNTVTGDCNPITINGYYQEDSTLTDDNWVEVQVHTDLPGNFEIKSDTVNGFSFYRTGYVSTGDNTIRLLASGKPDTAVVTTFHVICDSSVCTFTINVLASTVGAAHYVLGGSPGACAAFTPHGTYTVGSALDASDSITFLVNVSTTGTYNISTATVNGMKFSGSGSFANTGVTQVTLHGSGTPTSSAAANFSPTGDGTTCTFSITPGAGTPAVYVLGGSPGGACTNVTLAGPYMATIPTSSVNTVTVDVNVTTIGTYSMATSTANGVMFSKSGTFTATGAQQVTLVANGGTPTASGPASYTITGASTTCTFTITYAAAPPPAVFTLSGGPGACAPATVNGTYTVGVALNSTNNIVVEVNVSTAGVYSITTGSSVGGMQFTASGVFTSTGTFNVTLAPTAGSNPTTAGVNTLTPSGNGGATMCSFDITVNAAPTGILTCNIDGVAWTFNFDAHATVTYFVFGTNETDLDITGRLLPVGGPSDTYNLSVSKIPGGSIPAMSYDENTFVNTAGTYKVGMDYFNDATSTYWSVSDNTPFTPNPHFVINVTTLNATNCIGTFSGTITENFGAGPGTKVITNGVFNVPVQ